MLRRFIQNRERSLALRSLGTAIQSGIGPVEALGWIEGGRLPQSMLRACRSAIALLQQGERFHTAVTRGEPPLVDPIDEPIILAAEEAGSLAEVLQTLADGYEQTWRDLTALIGRL